MKQNNKAQQKYGTEKQASASLASLDTKHISKRMEMIIKRSSYFFLATSSKNAEPNINYKGGEKGFVHVLDNHTILFPDYHGNGILHGINDIMENPSIAMLFIDFVTGERFKLNGLATIIDEVDPYLNLVGFDFPQRVIKVKVNYIIGNCSKYIGNVKEHIFDSEEIK